MAALGAPTVGCRQVSERRWPALRQHTKGLTCQVGAPTARLHAAAAAAPTRPVSYSSAFPTTRCRESAGWGASFVRTNTTTSALDCPVTPLNYLNEPIPVI